MARQDRAPGLIACRGDEAVGWVSVGRLHTATAWRPLRPEISTGAKCSILRRRRHRAQHALLYSAGSLHELGLPPEGTGRPLSDVLREMRDEERW